VRLVLFLVPVLALASCSAVGPAAYPREQRLLLTYYWLTVDQYDASGDLDATTGFTNQNEPDVDGWDLQLDVRLDALNAVVGYSDREYGFTARADEYFGGLKWFVGSENTYFMAVGRYGPELDLTRAGVPMNGDAYFGYGVGGGVTSQMTENIFLDVKILYEDLFSDIDVGSSGLDLDGIVGSIGVGILF
jgi:opacity protein-like surface antigen